MAAAGRARAVLLALFLGLVGVVHSAPLLLATHDDAFSSVVESLKQVLGASREHGLLSLAPDEADVLPIVDGETEAPVNASGRTTTDLGVVTSAPNGDAVDMQTPDIVIGWTTYAPAPAPVGTRPSQNQVAGTTAPKGPDSMPADEVEMMTPIIVTGRTPPAVDEGVTRDQVVVTSAPDRDDVMPIVDAETTTFAGVPPTTPTAPATTTMLATTTTPAATTTPATTVAPATTTRTLPERSPPIMIIEDKVLDGLEAEVQVPDSPDNTSPLKSTIISDKIQPMSDAYIDSTSVTTIAGEVDREDLEPQEQPEEGGGEVSALMGETATEPPQKGDKLEDVEMLDGSVPTKLGVLTALVDEHPESSLPAINRDTDSLVQAASAMVEQDYVAEVPNNQADDFSTPATTDATTDGLFDLSQGETTTVPSDQYQTTEVPIGETTESEPQFSLQDDEHAETNGLFEEEPSAQVEVFQPPAEAPESLDVKSDLTTPQPASTTTEQDFPITTTESQFFSDDERQETTAAGEVTTELQPTTETLEYEQATTETTTPPYIPTEQSTENIQSDKTTIPPPPSQETENGNMITAAHDENVDLVAQNDEAATTQTADIGVQSTKLPDVSEAPTVMPTTSPTDLAEPAVTTKLVDSQSDAEDLIGTTDAPTTQSPNKTDGDTQQQSDLEEKTEFTTSVPPTEATDHPDATKEDDVQGDSSQESSESQDSSQEDFQESSEDSHESGQSSEEGQEGHESDESSEESSEQSGEQIDEQSAGQTGDPTGSQVGEAAGGELSGEQSEEQPGEQSGEKVGEQSEQQPGEKLEEQTSERPQEQSGKLAGEQSGGQTTERPEEQNWEQTGEQSGEQTTEQPEEQSGEQSGEEMGGSSGELSGEQSSEESGEETATTTEQPANLETSTPAPEGSHTISVQITSEATISGEDKSPPIVVSSLSAFSQISLRYARTLIRTELRNDATRPQEARISLDLPDEAFITGLSLESNGEVYRARVAERLAAHQQYQEAVLHGQSAAQVVASGRNATVFSVLVSIEPQQTLAVNLTYEELLARRRGRYRHVLTLRADQEIERTQIEVGVLESRNLTALAVNAGDRPLMYAEDRELALAGLTSQQSGLLSVKRSSWRSAIISISAVGPQQKELWGFDGAPRELTVEYDVDRGEAASGDLLLMDGYFVHFFAPPDLPPLRKHAILVLDTSGSMWGRKLRQVQQAMVRILDSLHPDDYFSIVQFASQVTEWSPHTLEVVGLREKEATLPATKEHISKAKKFISSMEASGGTNIGGALRSALKLAARRDFDRWAGHGGSAPSGSPPQPLIIFLTDGMPTVGTLSAGRILAATRAANGELRASVFSLSFGSRANWRFLQKLSLQNHGFARRVYESGDVAQQLHDFYREISSPLLTNVTFNYVVAKVNKTSVTKRNFPLLCDGGEIVVAGRYLPGEEADLLEAKVEGWGAPAGSTAVEGAAPQKLLFRAAAENITGLVPPPRTGSSDPDPKMPGILERLWAYLSIRQLLDRDLAETPDSTTASVSALDGPHGSGQSENSPKLRALYLALKYDFVTPLTSLIVVKPSNKPGNEVMEVPTDPVSEADAAADESAVNAEDFPMQNKISEMNLSKPGPDLPISFKPLLLEEDQTLNLDDIRWLPQYVDQTHGRILVNGTFYILKIPTSQELASVNKTTGQCQTIRKCQPLAKCVQAAFVDSYSVFVDYFCALGRWAGVCCPAT